MVQLNDLITLAIRAYSGISFSPDKRGNSIISESETELNKDLENMPEEEKERYIIGYKKHLTAWLSAKSNCISTMITGGSNFPVRRAEKANNSENNRLNEFINWRDNALSAIEKRKQENKPQSQKDNEEFERLKKGILSSCETITGIDNGTIRGSSRALFVSNLAGRITTIAKTGNVELITKCLDLIRDFNSNIKKPVISKNHSLWKLQEKAEARREAKVYRAGEPNKEYDFEGGTMIYNFSLDRLQLLFDGKPDQEIITKLKKNGFKWSPTNVVWQRLLNNNALHSAISIVGTPKPKISA